MHIHKKKKEEIINIQTKSIPAMYFTQNPFKTLSQLYIYMYTKTFLHGNLIKY